MIGPMRTPQLVAGLAATALFVAGCGDDALSGDDDTSDNGAVTISGQSFPEAALVAEMYRQVLEHEGYTPTVTLVDTRDVYMQQFPGDVDVVPEYVGGILDFLNTTVNGADAESITTADAEASIEAGEDLLTDQGIELLDPSSATDTNAFFVTQEFADAEGVSTLSDL